MSDPLPGGYTTPTPLKDNDLARRASRDLVDEETASEDDVPDLPSRVESSTPQRPARAGTSSGRASPTSSISSKRGTPRRRIIPRARAGRVSTATATTTSPRRTRPPPPPPPKVNPTLSQTFQILLTPLQLLLLPLQPLLSPIIFHLLNLVILSTGILLFIYFGLPRIPWALFWILKKVTKALGRGWVGKFAFSLDGLGDLGSSLMENGGGGVVALPLRTLAIPACALLNIACPLSLLSSSSSIHSSNGSTTSPETQERIMAKPFWKWSIFNSIDGGSEVGPRVNVGHVARVLTDEVRGARDIFESVRMLGDGGVAGGLDYVRVWEFGMTVLTGSNLDDKEFIGKQLIELGDLTRTLSDEVMNINSKTVSAFSWLQWEFSRLVHLLEKSPTLSTKDQDKLVQSLHSLLTRLSMTLDDLHLLTEKSVPIASSASSNGRELLYHLSTIRSSLEKEKSSSPIWKRAYDRSAHLIVGGEPSRTELIDRDLRISRDTIGNLHHLHKNLEDTRTKIKTFMNQVDGFHAGVMGFHLGAGGEEGLGAEEEVRILAGVVGELGDAVGAAKVKPTFRSSVESVEGERIGIEG